MKIGLVLLLFVDSSVVVGEVVLDFSKDCPQFFAKPNGQVSPPTVFPGNQYRQICQRQANQKMSEFATLYDTANRIPVYSAYEYVGRAPCNRMDVWYIEPQLDDQNKGPDMQSDTSSTLPKPPRGNNQALNEDYVNSGYDKGHLYSVFHTNKQSCADSTFTLTNAAPQNPPFNRGQWRKMESDVVEIFRSKCSQNRAYVVTGVVPSTGNTKILVKNRVNVPSHFWSAYCCLDNNNQSISSGGYLAPNSNQMPTNVTVNILEQRLTKLYAINFVLFGGMC
ncbi:endonuclease domain-containing 1 protein-like [Electrophorus electricus]|uniref:Uncharacterized protein n=1 Tax=Electrophorus electricus TaxID=8005 RepID=A0A4W4DPQ2_ELEEL|nr:endonuclease domain-containing 1 protein-like [Electrophorus electricus]